MELDLIKSPWMPALQALVRSAGERMVVAAPYVTADGWNALVSALPDPNNTEIDVCTSLDVDAVAGGYLDLHTLATACKSLPNLRLRHIPRLHAKVYVADGSRAIITSGNLTTSSLLHNKEYGVHISDRSAVAEIERDIREYAALGVDASCTALEDMAQLATRLRQGRAERQGREVDSEELADLYDLRLKSLRGERSDPRSAVFARTVLYLLRQQPMRTEDMHPLIRSIHPDLCDDRIERVIKGVKFGKRWKHDVRNAQQRLKAQGRIQLDARGHWQLLRYQVGTRVPTSG